MLQTLSIQNFAIIDKITVDFSSGLTVLTGETGAGKSIIIDALSLLAGSRGSTEYIRHGEQKAILQAQYTLPEDNHLKNILLENAIHCEDDTIILYRELHHNGKNVIRINGTLTNVTLLKQIGQFLIDIHGQHEHQYLMNEQYHLQLLDQFGSHELDDTLKAYYAIYSQYTTEKRNLRQLIESQKRDNARVDELKRHIKVIEAVNPTNDEDIILAEQYYQLIHEKNKYDAFAHIANQLFNDDNDIVQTVNMALSYVEQVDDKNEDIQMTKHTLLDISEQTKLLSRRVINVLDNMTFDEEQFNNVSKRSQQIEQLKDHFQMPLNDVIVLFEQCQKELDVLLNTDKYIAQAQKTFLDTRQALHDIGTQLSQKRHSVAEKLSQTIQQQLADLYMEKVQFKVHFIQQDKTVFKKNGLDELAFYAATNVGEPFKPLAKVASGGELSRMMLAMKAVFLKQQLIDTVVFDEIDTGVSGRVAQAIANKMALISRHTQVLAITHLPQVAAMAHTHAFVAKSVVSDRTLTTVSYLSDDQRQREIAKMFAGDDVSQSALQHAETLLCTAKQFRNQ